MTICPIAIVAGCKKCPAVSACPLKEILGDYVKEDPSGRPGNGSKSTEPGKQGD